MAILGGLMLQTENQFPHHKLFHQTLRPTQPPAGMPRDVHPIPRYARAPGPVQVWWDCRFAACARPPGSQAVF